MTRLLLCHQPTDGGVERHVRDLASGLVQHGYEPIVCSPAPPDGAPPGYEHVTLPVGRTLNPVADAAALAALNGVIRRYRPTLIHAHSSKAGALARLARLARPGTPVIYTPHGYAFAGYFEHRAERSLYRALERMLAPLACRVICVCQAEARNAHSIGPPGRVRMIHNGIDPQPAARPDPQIAALGGGPVIGALTLLRPGKGLETLIDTAPRVLARHPDARFAIVGGGPDLEQLRARAAGLGVADAVSFLGPSTDPQATLGALDIFVHPSWAEAFPYVVLEAMAAGRPIVAADVGGVGEAVTHGQSGLLVAPRDSDALAGALNRLLAEQPLRERLARAARERLASTFTRERMVRQTAAVYEELLA